MEITLNNVMTAEGLLVCYSEEQTDPEALFWVGFFFGWSFLRSWLLPKPMSWWWELQYIYVCVCVYIYKILQIVWRFGLAYIKRINH